MRESDAAEAVAVAAKPREEEEEEADVVVGNADAATPFLFAVAASDATERGNATAPVESPPISVVVFTAARAATGAALRDARREPER